MKLVELKFIGSEERVVSPPFDGLLPLRIAYFIGRPQNEDRELLIPVWIEPEPGETKTSKLGWLVGLNPANAEDDAIISLMIPIGQAYFGVVTSALRLLCSKELTLLGSYAWVIVDNLHSIASHTRVAAAELYQQRGREALLPQGFRPYGRNLFTEFIRPDVVREADELAAANKIKALKPDTIN